MITTIIVFMIIAALLLIVIILIQNPKDGGLSSEFGGGGTTQMFGVQKTGDILEKLTWGFFTFLIVAALGTGVLSKLESGNTEGQSDVNVEKSTTAPSLPAPSSVPALPGGTAPAVPAQ